MAIYLNIQLCEMCNFKTETADKVLKQSTWNQLQEQLQELSFQERFHSLLPGLPLDRLLWQTKGCRARYLKSRGLYGVVRLDDNDPNLLSFFLQFAPIMLCFFVIQWCTDLVDTDVVENFNLIKKNRKKCSDEKWLLSD